MFVLQPCMMATATAITQNLPANGAYGCRSGIDTCARCASSSNESRG